MGLADDQRRRLPWPVLLAMSVAGLVIIIGVFYDSPEDDSSGQASFPDTSTDTAVNANGDSSVPDDPLDQMVIAFDGSWSRNEIQVRLDRALVQYGASTTDQDRSRGGSALVALRQEYGVPEMEILDHMNCSYVEGVDISFPDMAGISAVAVINGDGCR